jgi:two-component system, chemotaxis family, CheB/CheR fusion protein
LYARKLEDKHIRVTRRYRGNAHISGYSGEIRQLFTNLLVNAIDALDNGGTIHVRVQPGRRWANGETGLRITFADNGRGIAPEGLRRIFEPFYSTKKDAGTGLGLWVAHGIVQKHGGSIRVRSLSEAAHHGTVFSIFMASGFEASRVA